VNYAASGGSEQRYIHVGPAATSTTIDASYAVYATSATTEHRKSSKSPKGDGKWASPTWPGNLWEWTLDWYANYATTCNNCADLTQPPAGWSGRRRRQLRLDPRSADRGSDGPWGGDDGVGARCARPFVIGGMKLHKAEMPVNPEP